MRLGERLLFTLSRDPGSADYPAGTVLANQDNALRFLDKMVPQFRQLIRDKKVLDYGCGWGWQAIAMIREGARSVVALDVEPYCLNKARKHVKTNGLADRIRVCDSVPPAEQGSFDVVVSCSSFEHFADPAGTLAQMRSAARKDGVIVVAFSEPWYSPHGSHMGFFCKLPWLNLLFPERTVMSVRRHFRSDGANRYEEIEGGLNRMTVRKFAEIIRESGLRVTYKRYRVVKGLPLLDKIPLVRELVVGDVSCVLTQ